MTELIFIALSWLMYGIVHSILASLACKQWIAGHWPRALPAYRLAYNVLATVLLLPPLWLTYRYKGDTLLQWPIWFSGPVALLVVAGYLWSMGHRRSGYDSQEFTGLKQLRQRSSSISDTESLHISPLHRFVRHPWYALGLLFLWTRDLNAAWLMSALCISAYIWLGSRLEERKLIERHGDVYQRYQSCVPGLLPWPGRSLSAEEAVLLEAEARQAQDLSQP